MHRSIERFFEAFRNPINHHETFIALRAGESLRLGNPGFVLTDNNPLKIQIYELKNELQDLHGSQETADQNTISPQETQ